MKTIFTYIWDFLEKDEKNKMKKWMNTKIKWTTKEDGGRKLPMAVN